MTRSELKQKLEVAIIEKAKHEDSDGYFGFLSGAEFLTPLLLDAYEALLDQSKPYEDGPAMYILRQFEDRIRSSKITLSRFEAFANGESK